jgi:hypothetical protein
MDATLSCLDMIFGVPPIEIAGGTNSVSFVKSAVEVNAREESEPDGSGINEGSMSVSSINECSASALGCSAGKFRAIGVSSGEFIEMGMMSLVNVSADRLLFDAQRKREKFTFIK